MVSVLASSAVDRGFELRSGHTRDYKIEMCFFSAKLAVLMSDNNDWLALNQLKASEWSDMSINELLFQWINTIKIQPSVFGLVQSGHHQNLIECSLFSRWYTETNVNLAWKHNHSFTIILFSEMWLRYRRKTTTTIRILFHMPWNWNCFWCKIYMLTESWLIDWLISV